MSVENFDSFRTLGDLLQDRFEIVPKYKVIVEYILNKYSPEAEMYYAM